ncbi:MAG: hypothetical protein IK143_03885 [Bacteroidales bacterium]|nr:hypothetical protein [Bacteroidales bacterium]
MKRILSIISAGLVLIAAASCDKDEKATFDASAATAPTLVSYNVTGDAVSANYTAGAFNMGFNEKLSPNHTLALISVEGTPVSTVLSSSDKDGVLSVTVETLSKALIALGYEENTRVSIEIAVRSTMQDISKDNGVNGYVDSESRISIADYEIVLPAGDPYQSYTETSAWGLTGSISSQSISWDGDVVMYTNGTLHVAKAVKLKAGEEVKFRRDGGWDVNFGYASGVSSYELGVEFSLGSGGDNIKIAEDGVYDLILNPDAGTARIIASVVPVPYADYTETSAWGLIGTISSQSISWDGDVVMYTNGTLHVAKAVELKAGEEVKFRRDGGWDVNFGYASGVSSYELGVEFSLGSGGDNIKIAEDGVYDLILNPDAGTAKIINTIVS